MGTDFGIKMFDWVGISPDDFQIKQRYVIILTVKSSTGKGTSDGPCIYQPSTFNKRLMMLIRAEAWL